MVCADCRAEIDHCHGTLVVHREGIAECTVTRCVGLDPARHSLIIDCQDGSFGCSDRLPAPLRWAS